MRNRKKYALISVSDKSDLFPVLKTLKKFKFSIISSGGTYRFIKKRGFECQELSDFTEFNEMLDGRVKTLHPKIHAGILFNRKKKSHFSQMKKAGFHPIDLIIVNFYPFKKTLLNSVNENKIIDNIDIGGPTMVRAAAKNFNNVTIVSDKSDYIDLVRELNKRKGSTSLSFRKNLARKAFNLTSFYDSMISEWFNDKLNIKFPEKKIFYGEKIKQLRYGENPHQKSSFYINDLKDRELNFEQLNGKELSYNNFNDIFASLDILFSEKKYSTTVIIKHANPCGVAYDKSALKSFLNAKASDPVSAFGGVVACDYKINTKIAKEIHKTFFEVILARGFDRQALKILKSKKNMRVIDISKLKYKADLSVKVFNNSFLLQEKDKFVFNKRKLKFVTKIKPTIKEINDLEFAFRVCKFVKSNAIVLVKNNATIGIGAGQQNRLDSCKIAVQKAKQFQPGNLRDSIAASDAFFPFSDGVKTLINAGVKLIIQPGGSIRDKEVIETANKAKIKMIFTGVRHFNH